MKLSNKFTLARALFAPVFFLIYNLPLWLNSDILSKISACIMIPLLAVIQLTDYWDGHYARKNNEVSDFGKLFDPFADVTLNLTVFLCATKTVNPAIGLPYYMPICIFVLILWREYSQSFLRMVASKQGVAIAARKGGKFKTVFYIISAFFFLTCESYLRLGLNFGENIQTVINTIIYWFKAFTLGLFVLCAIFSWASFVDYIKSFYFLIKKQD